MKIVECRGSDRRIGEMAGESLRMEIQEHVARFVKEEEKLAGRIRDFTHSTARYMPHILEQLKGIARGANTPEEKIFALNLPAQGKITSFFEQRCSNVLFKSGLDGVRSGEKITKADFLPAREEGLSAF